MPRNCVKIFSRPIAITKSSICNYQAAAAESSEGHKLETIIGGACVYLLSESACVCLLYLRISKIISKMSTLEVNGAPGKLQLPSPIITKRTRTASTSERALENPESVGVIQAFCREKGHGFITPENGSEIIFVHVSDIEGEYIPLPGDKVKYRLCPIPPKFEKLQAVHVHIINLTPEKHLKWDCPKEQC